MANIKKSIVAAHAAQLLSSCDLAVLCTTSSENDSTCDGIDISAARAVAEIDSYIESLERGDVLPDSRRAFPAGPVLSQPKVTKFSIIGYSLGGCIARFVIGLLHSRSPSFFQIVEACNFTTFASPAIGIPRLPSLGASICRTLSISLMSRIGKQLYAADDYIDGRPLVEVISQPGTPFYDGLLKFKHKSIYANISNDKIVPYVTGFFPDANEDVKIRRDEMSQQSTAEQCPWIVIDGDVCSQPMDLQFTSRPKSRQLPLALRPSTYNCVPYGLGRIVPLCLPLAIVPAYFALRHRSQSRIDNVKETAYGRLLEKSLATAAIAFQVEQDEGYHETDSELSNLPATAPSIPNASRLSPAQLRAITNLNSIPDLRKYGVHMPDIACSHGAIVAKDLAVEGHDRGLSVLAFWASQFNF